jgi:hypothetical protein
VTSALSQVGYGRVGALNSDECHEGRSTMSSMGCIEAYYDASTTWEPRGPAAAKVRSTRLLEHLANREDAPVV